MIDDTYSLVDAHLDAISSLYDTLAKLRSDHAELTAERRRREAEAWFASQQSTVTDRQREADYLTYATDVPKAIGAEILRKEAAIRAAEDEVEYRKLCLTHGR